VGNFGVDAICSFGTAATAIINLAGLDATTLEEAMRLSMAAVTAAAAMFGLAIATPASALPFFFSTGDPDGRMATASRPGTAGVTEIESADDFDLTASTTISSATFTGLLTGGSSVSDVQDVVVEIYRVFPNDSDVTRTSGPPTFSTSQVPTRVNSPADVELDSRDSADGTLSFSVTSLSTFTANNSVLPGGIHPKPGQTTTGNGSVTGEEVEFDVSFTTSLMLPPDHYFFVPQVELDSGNFLWLSAPRPIVPPGTAFPPGVTDLQSWTRDAALDPDWLRVGTDIVGGTTPPTFNAAFSLTGVTIPEPTALMLFGTGLAGLRLLRRRSA
jgi:hypothetical protein